MPKPSKLSSGVRSSPHSCRRKLRPPSVGWQPMIFDNDLYLVQSDTDAMGRLLATSLVEVGSLRWIGGSCVTAVFIITIVAGGLGRRFLRSHFAMAGTRVPTLNEAQQSGEGQRVEFKRGFSAEEVRTGGVERGAEINRRICEHK
jgi:hypothetical protein